MNKEDLKKLIFDVNECQKANGNACIYCRHRNQCEPFRIVNGIEEVKIKNDDKEN